MTSAMRQVSQQMTEMKLNAAADGPQAMRRPAGEAGYGTKGRAFPVKINAFKVLPPDMTAYHYDVKISPSEDKRPARLNREIWKALVRVHNPFGGIAVAYDGRAMAYSPKELPNKEGQWEINLGGEGKRADIFHLKLTFIRPIHLDALRAFVTGSKHDLDEGVVMSATQALNVVIQHGPMMTHPSRAASFFPSPADPRAVTISKGLELWRGYYTSLRPAPQGLYINVDLASHTFIVRGNLPDVMLAYARAKARNIGPQDLAADRIPGGVAVELGRFLRGLKITLKVKGSDGREPVRKIRELTRLSAAASTFETDDGSTTNVADYFQAHYNIRLQHRDWPCIRVSKVALYPIELCEVEAGNKYSKKLDPQQTAEALKHTTIQPKERGELLRRGIEMIRPTTGTSPLTQWQLDIKPDLIDVTARQLPSPEVTYKKPIRPRDGVWDLRGQRFYQSCAPIERWCVFVFDNPRFFSQQDAQQSVMGLVRGLESVGVQVVKQQPEIIYVPQNVRADSVGTFIRNEAKKLGFNAPPQLIVCYLSRKPCDEYGAIKRFGDLDVGVATQCLSVPKAKRGNPQYYGNIALKINVKLNGTNSTVNMGPALNVPTMILGADVYHPAPGSFAPSIAAVVGSVNKEVSLYASAVSVQSSRTEMIQGLDEMVMKILKQAPFKPQRIIMYRDGVSEGQFSSALAVELNAIRLACQRIDPNYKPAITYIVTGKRHHISIFPKLPADGDRTGNVKAGTIVDTEVTHPFQFDFYLQSHASLLGTSRSAHYTVIYDDNKFSADVLQQLTFNLCHTYARATRSVSYATPAYYADRLCTRAALYLNADADDAASAVSTHSGESAEAERTKLMGEYRAKIKAVHANHAKALFFM